jgi:hypothetical protein
MMGKRILIALGLVFGLAVLLIFCLFTTLFTAL